MASDNSLCVPALNRGQLEGILALLISKVANGPRGKLFESAEKPKINFDLEHLQVADYGLFPGVTEEIGEYIRKLNSDHPIPSEELYYIALQSLIGLAYPVQSRMKILC